MKYGITHPLERAILDRLERLHVALLRRAYERQQGAAGRHDALDAALELAAAWDAPSEPHGKDST